MMIKRSKEVPQKQHNEDRMRRARSWLGRSKKVAERYHNLSDEAKAARDCEQFIFLWVAFNAAYGQELLNKDQGNESPTQTTQFNDFLSKIIARDTAGTIKTILWNTYTGPVRELLKNFYVYGHFWKWVREGGEDWKHRFDKSKRAAFNALGKDDVKRALNEVFSRLYVLRNQLFHGGATHASGWGRSQVRDGSRIMAELVPAILDIMAADMEKNPDSDIWGPVAFPRISEEPDAGIQ